MRKHYGLDNRLMQPSHLNQSEMEEHAEDNPALSKVIERNIRTMIHLRLKAARERSVQDRIADATTAFSGRMVFVYVHMVGLVFGFFSTPDLQACVLSTPSPTDS